MTATNRRQNLVLTPQQTATVLACLVEAKDQLAIANPERAELNRIRVKIRSGVSLELDRFDKQRVIDAICAKVIECPIGTPKYNSLASLHEMFNS